MFLRTTLLGMVFVCAIMTPAQPDSVPDWMVDGLNTVYDAIDPDRWHDNPGLARQGCLLKRKSRSIEEARPFCERALELDPSNPETLFQVGMFRRAEDRHLDAFYLLRYAAEQGHAEAMVWTAVAILSYDVEAARKWASRAVEEHPSEPTAWTASCMIEAAIFGDRLAGHWSKERVADRCAQAEERDGKSPMFRGIQEMLQRALQP
ncbi:MAG: hypothetical protein AAGK00_01730 [Pseudomonadota bacterium]